ncbi:hypothetical protein FA95DRAFT_1613479 [Auriscalpium vulgare]|uniref:Uncharacterized protein n=1 Tax=Auriscalpium vulgare TaxID=40419 RepID=A0ACB8R2I4_9AGAM|nr:hypothetical protein FA95DRAFT_1613479 [Auriscalpium vulgare]
MTAVHNTQSSFREFFLVFDPEELVEGGAATATVPAKRENKNKKKKKGEKGGDTLNSGAVVPPVSQSDVLSSTSAAPGPSSTLQSKLVSMKWKERSVVTFKWLAIITKPSCSGLDVTVFKEKQEALENGVPALEVKLDALKEQREALKIKDAAYLAELVDRVEQNGKMLSELNAALDARERRMLLDAASALLFQGYGISSPRVTAANFDDFLRESHDKLKEEHQKLLDVRALRMIYSNWGAVRESTLEGDDRTALENIHTFCQGSYPTL